MAKAQGGSFIPKRSTGKAKPSRAGKRVYILSYIAYIFFFGTLMTVVGIYLLNRQAETQLAEHVEMLDEERANFQQGRLDTVQSLHDRLRSAERILNSHLATSRIFDELEPVVIESVQIRNFSFRRSSGGQSILSLDGSTNSFDELMFQREVIKTSDFLSAAKFVQVSYGNSENVIDGANRDGTRVSRDTQGPQISFVFEDSSLKKQIGYQPRDLTAPPQGNSGPSGVNESDESVAATSSLDEADVNQES